MSEVLSKFSCDHIPEGDSCGLVVTLVEQNAKLRELVSELYQCSRQEGCDHCGYKDGCSMFDRMAQMGIEVG